MTAEVRTVSSTGGEKGIKPRTFHLLPWKALGVIAEHFGLGAEKYDAHNWRRGYEWSKSYSALQRHLADWWEGEERDEDGLHNLAAAGFHVLVLITFAIVDRGRYGQFDDRYIPQTDLASLVVQHQAEVSRIASALADPAKGKVTLVKAGYGRLTVLEYREGGKTVWEWPETGVGHTPAEWADAGWVAEATGD